MFIYHCPLRHVIALTRLHIIFFDLAFGSSQRKNILSSLSYQVNASERVAEVSVSASNSG
jgi:ABC-type transport system involved in Fe-S cluster assembly fused permease/ATPase subunit